MSDQRFDSVFMLRAALEKSILSSIAADLATYDRLNAVAFKKDRARFECVVRVGMPTGHRKVLSPTDRRYDMFNFTMAVTVISAAAGALRRNDGETDADFAARQAQQNSFHEILVAHMDAYLSQIQLASLDDLVNFPVLTLLVLRGAGHEPDLKPTEGVEQTKMNYSGQFGIRPSAWQA